MEGLSDVVSYLTGADIDVDRIPESLAACRAYIVRELPALSGIAAEDVDFESWRSWLDSQEDELGEWHILPRPAPGEVTNLAHVSLRVHRPSPSEKDDAEPKQSRALRMLSRHRRLQTN